MKEDIWIRFTRSVNAPTVTSTFIAYLNLGQLDTTRQLVVIHLRNDPGKKGTLWLRHFLQRWLCSQISSAADTLYGSGENTARFPLYSHKICFLQANSPFAHTNSIRGLVVCLYEPFISYNTESSASACEWEIAVQTHRLAETCNSITLAAHIRLNSPWWGCRLQGLRGKSQKDKRWDYITLFS